MGPGLSALLWGSSTALLCLLVETRWGSEEPSGLLWLWALLVLLSAVGGAVAVLAHRPLRLLRLLEALGYFPEPSCTHANVAHRLHRRSQPTGQLPPVYPNGWFCLLDSEQLRPGAVRHVSALGEEFAVFRGLDGKAYVVDAYCPHLGANLGVGGQVVGSCIECPFHGWQFRGEDGQCTRIPYAEKVPECAKIKVWPSCEVAGMIAIWYHCDGIDPTWQIPEQEVVSSQEWVLRGISEHFINVHIQEISENAVDTAHFSSVHGPSFLSGADLRYSNSKVWGFFKHTWQVEWQPEPEPNTHRTRGNVKHSLMLFGKHCSLLDIDISTRQDFRYWEGYSGNLTPENATQELLDWWIVGVGPGLAFFTFKQPYLGHAVVIHSTTPVEPLQQLVIQRMYYQRHIPALVSKFLFRVECIQFQRDVMVWHNKRYVSNPLLVKEDGPIQKYRRWFSQFYSENSPKLMSHKAPLDW